MGEKLEAELDIAVEKRKRGRMARGKEGRRGIIEQYLYCHLANNFHLSLHTASVRDVHSRLSHLHIAKWPFSLI